MDKFTTNQKQKKDRTETGVKGEEIPLGSLLKEVIKST